MLVHGGDFSNIDAPVKIEASTYPELEKEIKANFGIENQGWYLILRLNFYLKIPEK